MTAVEERLAALEADNAALKALVQNLQRFVQPGATPVPNVYVNGSRFSVDTTFWSAKDLGQGAAVSIASADRFALYAETDEIRCQDQPSIAIYGAVTEPNPFMQNNIGVLGVANNGVVNYGLMSTSGDRTVGFRREGAELIGSWDRFLIGPIGGPYRQLWP